MVSPLELRALGSNRDVSTGKLWVWRILSIVVIANAGASAGSGIALGGAIVGAGGVMFAILYALGDEVEESPTEQAAA